MPRDVKPHHRPLGAKAGDARVACWVVSDGRRGIENQALGLAEAVGRRRALVLETLTIPRPDLAVSAAHALGLGAAAPPQGARAPDLWIGCGRAALLAAPAHKRAHPDARFVYVQDPKRDHALFDLIVAPAHDGLEGDNVIAVTGSTNRITPERLAEARMGFPALDALPRPRAAVLIGGASKRHSLDPASATGLAAALRTLAAAGAGLMVTTSRRTPPRAAALIGEALAGFDNVTLWAGEADGPNPYFAFLASADVAIVTKDSTNMLTEAATAGLPVLIAELKGRDGKFERLYDALIRTGRARPFKGALETWQVKPLAETERAADAVIGVLDG